MIVVQLHQGGATGGLSKDAGEHLFTLQHDSWNDWWTFETLYSVTYRPPDGAQVHIGGVKIGCTQELSDKRPPLPSTFTELDETFFSLGQDESYYTKLIALPGDVGLQFLTALRDVVADEAIYEKNARLKIMRDSLLRSVSVASVKGQFSRIVAGGDRRRSFDLTYTEDATENAPGFSMEFAVAPLSMPPTNIHVLIGRNGSGKTRMLQRLAKSLVRARPGFGWMSGDGLPARESVASVGYVSFSAFDNAPPIQSGKGGVRVFNVGLKKLVEIKTADGEMVEEVALKTTSDISTDMSKALRLCTRRSYDRWKDAVETLESDPIFRDIDATSLANGMLKRESMTQESERKFRRLSSGHQVVLLTITALVAQVEERSLVLLDEPEGHLHPPLLSAFIRALSRILTDRNAFAIVATHSPVILQEVPAKCVHLVQRSGFVTSLRRPSVETFAENVGVLTREVFGLEVDGSGFHRLLAEAALELDDDYEAVIERFEGEIGAEGRALLSAMLRSQAPPKLEF